MKNPKSAKVVPAGEIETTYKKDTVTGKISTKLVDQIGREYTKERKEYIRQVREHADPELAKVLDYRGGAGAPRRD